MAERSVTEKQCTGCIVIKPSTDFFAHRQKKSGLAPRCKSCYKAYTSSPKCVALRLARYERHKEKLRQQNNARYAALPKSPELRQKQRSQFLRLTYGLTIAEYDAMLEKQGRVCAICGQHKNGKRLVVDHCHHTNKVRGLLCKRCNVALAAFGDDLQGIMQVVTYLTNAEAEQTY